jgi:hypothetical protein
MDERCKLKFCACQCDLGIEARYQKTDTAWRSRLGHRQHSLRRVAFSDYGDDK